MPDADRITPPTRADATVRTIVSSWRALTGGRGVRDAGRRTLVACSGGADSSALLLALATVRPGPEACHVVHDMRPQEEADRDAERTTELCDQLGVRCHTVRVSPGAQAGNAEANARTHRYGALADLASARGLRFVATGHHADDQLETVLMRLLRGAGVRGMAGIRETRELTGSVRIVRPMLGVTRDEAVGVCTRAGWRWNDDATNADRTRLRSALRAGVLPALRAVDPQAAVRATRTASAMASADEAIGAWAGRVAAGARDGEPHAGAGGRVPVWIEREKLVDLPRSVLVSLFGVMYDRIVGETGRDRISQRVIGPCIGGIVGKNGATMEFDIAEMRVRITTQSVEFYKK